MWGSQETLGGFAVAGFFAISGYLVLRSALAGDVFQFMWKRALRIFPGYWVALLAGVLAVGPIVWLCEGRRLGTYFLPGDKSVFTYLSANFDLSIGTFGVWDIFESTTPYGVAVGAGGLNGSIWTLTYEWSSYLVVGALLGFGLLRFTRVTVVITAGIFGFINAVYFFDQQLAMSAFGGIVDRPFAGFGFIFFVGASIAAYAEKIPFSRWVGIACGIAVAVSLVVAGWRVIGFFSVALFSLVASCGVAATSSLDRTQERLFLWNLPVWISDSTNNGLFRTSQTWNRSMDTHLCCARVWSGVAELEPNRTTCSFAQIHWTRSWRALLVDKTHNLESATVTVRQVKNLALSTGKRSRVVPLQLTGEQ
jgi:peptidoglycan/LPS O-acetylase OafA/YrhL